MFVRPGRLNDGDTLGIIAPASAPSDPAIIDRAVEALESMGFRARLGPNARKRWGFLAGSDRERAADLMRMFKDPKVAGILCVRGGYGTARLLPRLDFDLIRRHPKVFMGYSDITALHCALQRRAGLLSFHGPMLTSDLLKDDCPAFTLEGWRRTVMSPAAPGSILQGYRGNSVSIVHRGRATGRLVGGNLSILCSTLGTPYEPRFRGNILFFEDLDEPPYRVDRMLTQLILGNRLSQVVGVAIGINRRCVDPKAGKRGEYRQTLEDVFRERLRPLGIPVVAGLPFGHVRHNATLPVGGRAVLDAERGDLVICEPVVE